MGDQREALDFMLSSHMDTPTSEIARILRDEKKLNGIPQGDGSMVFHFPDQSRLHLPATEMTVEEFLKHDGWISRGN